MSRRRRLKKSEPSAIRLERVVPGKYRYYFRGYRRLPPTLWHIEKQRLSVWFVTNTFSPELKICTGLPEVRKHIADQYEYV